MYWRDAIGQMRSRDITVEGLCKWLAGARTVLLIGVGNISRGDDGAGTLVAGALKRWSSDRFRVMNAEEAPGRLLPDAVDLKPSHVILVDAAQVGGPPGSLGLLETDEIESARFFSTHDLPLPIVLGILASETGARVITVGIQPGSVGTLGQMNHAVRDSCARLSELLVEALRSAGILA